MTLSNLSNSPPWPGNKLPESLILKFLFKSEAIKSPNMPVINIKEDKIYQYSILKNGSIDNK